MKWGNNTRWNSFRPVFEPIAESGKTHGVQVNDSVHTESTPEQSELGSFPRFRIKRKFNSGFGLKWMEA